MSPESLQRKIADEMTDGSSAQEAAARIKDSLRYTMTHPEESLTVGARRTLSDLKAQGYEIRDVKNYFVENNSYKGVNVELRTPEGQPFELQFHTPESFDLKMSSHTDYEVARDMSQPLELRQRAHDRMLERSGELQQPPGIDLVGRPVRLERPVQ